MIHLMMMMMMIVPSDVVHQGKSPGVVTNGIARSISSHPRAGTLPLRRISSP